MEQLHAMAIHNNTVELARLCVLIRLAVALTHSLTPWISAAVAAGAGQWAQKPSSTPPVPWETPGECLLSGRIGQKKESREGGGGRRGGKSKEGEERRGEESIGRITQTQWNIPNYVSAGQIPPCGHIVMREWDIWGNERASVWQNVWGPIVRLYLSSFFVFWKNIMAWLFPSYFSPLCLHRTEVITPSGCISHLSHSAVFETSGSSWTVLSTTFVVLSFNVLRPTMLMSLCYLG